MKIYSRIAIMAGAACLAASPTLAATITTPSGVTVQNLVSGTNLNNSSRNGVVYLFNEGTVNGITSYLLHYGRGGLLSGDDYDNNGSFGITLGVNEVFAGVATTTAALIASDRSIAGVTYSGDFARGLEDPSVLFFGDTLTTSSPNPVAVTFRLRTANNSSDEARFFVRSVPEPTTWAMMLAGFGMVGAGLRRSKFHTRIPAA